jgi:hypothetical protein
MKKLKVVNNASQTVFLALAQKLLLVQLATQDFS